MPHIFISSQATNNNDNQTNDNNQEDEEVPVIKPREERVNKINRILDNQDVFEYSQRITD